MRSKEEMLSRDNSQETREPSPDSEWPTNESKKKDYVMSNDPKIRGYKPEPVPCKYCGKPRYTKGRIIYGEIHWFTSGPEPCDCEEAKAEQLKNKIERARMEEVKRHMKSLELIRNSGMSARFRKRTFDTFIITDENKRALRACKAYADTFKDKQPENNPDPGRNGLFITGPKGTGKTHLASAIANQLLNEGVPVICMTMIDLLDKIKQTFERHGNTGSESYILRAYKEAPLLIIDDMGKEPATEWAVSKIYAIINARYEAYMPTIITTNYTDDELVRRLTPKESSDQTTADATIDRLREMCAGIITSGDSWRSR